MLWLIAVLKLLQVDELLFELFVPRNYTHVLHIRLQVAAVSGGLLLIALWRNIALMFHLQLLEKSFFYCVRTFFTKTGCNGARLSCIRCQTLV